MEYHKIQTIFKRDPAKNHKTLLPGEFSKPEFKYLANNDWVFTEKIDGTNIRVMWDGVVITFGGRTERAQIPASLLAELMNKFTVEKMTAKFGDTSVILFGEGYGPKIQKGGGLYRSDPGFIMFDVRIGDWWLTREAVCDIGKSLHVDVVPFISQGTLSEMVARVQHGQTSHFGGFHAEGIVARPKVELTDRSGHRIITKLKHKDFPR